MQRNEFDSIRIGLASPEMIRNWSYGEVVKPETINYRTLKPEEGGLFCERIFGPTKDGACSCGKYKNSHNKELFVCEKCGVPVTTKKVRRERMGHIELAAPVSHIWYLKNVPSRMALILGMKPKQLEQVLYFAETVITWVEESQISSELYPGLVVTEKELEELNTRYNTGDTPAFESGMGAEAIQILLKKIDLDKLSFELKSELEKATGQRKAQIIRRLEVVESFRKSRKDMSDPESGNKPEWMILNALPVLPADLRPMVQLDGGRFATSDVNELYRRVINRNNRLKKMIEIEAPEIVIRNEKRMLQEAVDALIDNGRRGKPVTGPNNRTLKCLSELLRGKQGRFRQNLLGKRVDYSGRSVIVVGPSLKIYQCGLPKEMALELFKPFVVKRLEEIQRIGVKDALKKIEKAYENPCVWDALENVIKEHPVLLNRAPTLHRLSIQAFEPVLVEGRAIKLHPLVCTAFNADFDGDQMPVHVPLSAEAQAEARFLMLSANNLLKPMDGRAVAVPSQDMILGSYYLTMDKPGEPGEGKVFRDFDEAMMAYDNGALGLHAPIKIRKTLTINGVEKTKLINATLGRLIFNRPIPQDLGFIKRDTEDSLFELEIQTVVKKKELGKLIDYCIKKHGFAVCAEMLDSIKEMGYKYSTRASFSISVYDMTIPAEKKEFIAAAQKKVDAINATFDDGLLTDEERYNNVIKVWEKTTNDVTNALQKGFDQFNPIKIMSDSGARGSIAQMRQLAGMRGLMFATNGKTIELPIKSNFREGLNILEYFMGAKGSRKSLSDTALRTADSGYLTRRLVDVSQDVIVREEKCDTKKGAWVEPVIDENNNTVLENLQDRIMGRYTIGEIVDPRTGDVIVGDDEMISEEQAKAIADAGITRVNIRTVIQCRAKHGICAHCYGADLASGNPVKLGEAVGIIAAQSIGEPGTQLTMRTFHSGGVAGSDITQGLPRVEELFEARTPKKTAVLAKDDGVVVRVEPGDVPNTYLVDVKTAAGDVLQHHIPFGKRVMVNVGAAVNKGDSLTDGSKAPSEIRAIFEGEAEAKDPENLVYLDKIYEYIIKEIQKVYRSQSCNVNDKHIEIIARQMTRKTKIYDKGDTELLEDSLVDVTEFESENAKIQARIDAGEDLKLAVGKPEFLGITKASLQTESFLSAASFQETTKVLTDAAIRGKVDNLIGLKENVIIGKLIPAGTGMAMYNNVEVQKADAVSEKSEEDFM